jgi:hypothetical protein
VVRPSDILLECVRGNAGTLTLSQHVGLPLAVSAGGPARVSNPVLEETSRQASRDPRQSLGSTSANQVQPGSPHSRVLFSTPRLTAGSFDTVVIDRPGKGQAGRLRQDPDFIRAWASGVVLVKLGPRRGRHPSGRGCFSHYAKGWSLLNREPSVRVSRYIAGLAKTSPAHVLSVWGQSLNGCAANPPNQLLWLRSSPSLPWASQGCSLHRNTSIQKWLEETSKSRATLDTVIRTSYRARRGIGLICQNGTLPEFRGRNCPLTCYGSRPYQGGHSV